MEDLKVELQGKMDQAVRALHDELQRVHTGRAHPSLIEHLLVDIYGSQTPLKQVASIHASDARTLALNVWDKANVSAIEKVIMTSGLGLNPNTSGTSIHIPIPALTQERRQGLIKIVGQAGEQSKVSVRNARKDAMKQIKLWLKEKEISEDEANRFEQQVQTETDEHAKKIDQTIADKEKDLTVF
jgi:ribosome recycling factor